MNITSPEATADNVDSSPFPFLKSIPTWTKQIQHCGLLALQKKRRKKRLKQSELPRANEQSCSLKVKNPSFGLFLRLQAALVT